jgi:ribonuclease HI
MSAQTPQMEVFDELRLRQEINGKWGAHGAHAEVYSMLLTDRDRLKALCEELREALHEIAKINARTLSGHSASDSLEACGSVARAALKKAEQAPKP